MSLSLRALFCVWKRYFDVFKKNLIYGVVTTFVTPIIYLISFGFGMSRMLPQINMNGVNISYKNFVFAGIVGQTLLFQGFFEAAYGGFVRMYYQKIFKSISLTSITLKEVLAAELCWNSSRALFSSMALLVIGLFAFDFTWVSVLLTLPVLLFSSILFSSMGLVSAALAKTIESLSYPQLLFVVPMTLFCGVYYPLQAMPSYLRPFLQILPLLNTVDLLRSALFALPFSWVSVVSLCVWTFIFVPWSQSALEKRVRA